MDNAVDREPEEFDEEELFVEELDEENEEIVEVGAGEEAIENDVPPVVEPSSFDIAGFWRRAAAVIVDSLLISIPFFILGFLFQDQAFALGPYGVVIGYGVFTIYWGILNSEIGEGQTLGKRALKIAVVDEHGHYLSLQRSFVRAIVLGLIFLFGEGIISIFGLAIVDTIISLVTAVAAALLSYGFIFNRTTRQGTHDLIAKSYVVNIPPNLEVDAPLLPKKHKQFMVGISIIVALIFIGAAFITIPNFGIMNDDEQDEMIALQSELEEKDGVFSAGIERINRTAFGSGVVLKDLNISLWVSQPCMKNQSYCEQLVDETARLVLEEFDGIENLDGMKITVTNRFDFGFTQGNFAMGAQLRLEDWQKRLSE